MHGNFGAFFKKLHSFVLQFTKFSDRLGTIIEVTDSFCFFENFKPMENNIAKYGYHTFGCRCGRIPFKDRIASIKRERFLGIFKKDDTTPLGVGRLAMVWSLFSFKVLKKSTSINNPTVQKS